MARENGIQVMAYNNIAQNTYYDQNEGLKENSLLQSPVLQGISLRHGKSVVQVMLRWAVQRGTAALPQSNTIDNL